MFSLNDLQNRWVLLALSGGVILVLGMVLACLALWRPRREAGADASPPAKPDFFAGFPWFLALTIGALMAYAIVYVIVQATNPPNW
jgi:hypothetical protein